VSSATCAFSAGRALGEELHGPLLEVRNELHELCRSSELLHLDRHDCLLIQEILRVSSPEYADQRVLSKLSLLLEFSENAKRFSAA
jgi:hypothetical protein